MACAGGSRADEAPARPDTSASTAPPNTFETPLEKIAPFNDRTTPRRTLETFWFAVLGYDLTPALIVNAIDCLDLGAIDPAMRERDAALMAHELNFITSRLDIPLYTVPEKTTATRVTLTDAPGFPIVMTRQADGRWRFDRETITAIGRMRAAISERDRPLEAMRQKMAEGRTDPETTMRAFLASIVRRDFVEAARCLDLRDVPPNLRAERGPELARRLAFVVQRCGFVFPQEMPCDPTGFRFVWHSNHRGRILLERVRMAGGEDGWLFSRATLLNLDRLVTGFRRVEPDARYRLLGVVLDESVLAAGTTLRVPPPPRVPAAIGTPRSTLRTFLSAMDDLEFDESKARLALDCLDLSDLPPAERSAVGLRLAAKLQAVIQREPVDILSVPDSWEGDPHVVGHDADWTVTIARQADGAWRFDSNSLARVPEMFDQLTPEQKAANEVRSSFHSARQTMRTLLHAVNTANLEVATECLNLDALPPGSRADLGPLLAVKLKYAIDRLGAVSIQDIPDEATGPRHFFYRGPLGRIDLVRRDTPERHGDWQFSAETVARLESLFRGVIDREPAASLASTPGVRTDLAGLAPALWIRLHLPRWSQARVFGLDLYHWVGLTLIVTISVILGRMALVIATRMAARLLLYAELAMSRPFLRSKLRPLSLQLTFWVFLLQLRLLDLPVPLISGMLPVFKVLWIGVLAWTAFGLIDLVMAIYDFSEHLNHQRSLSDMIVPTAVRGLKLVVVLLSVAGQVYLVGSAETLTRLLAGLGLVGLAASLAAQDTLKNFFGTLLLIGEHPFRIGDLIVVNGMEGTVESVGFRSTRIRTGEDSLLTIPNSTIASSSIDNRGARMTRRLRRQVLIALGTPMERVVALRDRLREFALSHPRVRRDKVEIHIDGIGASAIELLVQVHLRVDSGSIELACRDEFSREILRLCDELEIELGANGPVALVGPRIDPVGRGVPSPHLPTMARTEGATDRHRPRS
ncbi:MAG: mechanosensitive ion channel family protein [Isosphaeraceae bacterium]